MSHQQFASCIDACNACALACSHCATSCLDEPDPKAMARCIRLDLDCAAICRLAVEVMGRGSENAATICSACAELCELCAEECGQHQMDHCQACAQACRQCVQACRGMAQAPSGRTSATGAHAH